MVKINYAAIAEKVKEAIGSTLLTEIVRSVEDMNPRFWAKGDHRDFSRVMITYTLYKSLESRGHGWLRDHVDWPIVIGKNSWIHNYEVCLEHLAMWGKDQIQLQDKNAWNREADQGTLPNMLNKVNLWIDSIDFPFQNKIKNRKDNPYWSSKEKSSAFRYMIVFTGNRRIVKVWGGYSPKIYDDQFLEGQKDYIDAHMEGAVFIGDEHYRSARLTPSKASVVTCIPKPRKRRLRDGTEAEAKLTQEQETYNAHVRSVRARVELPSVIIKNMFRDLTIKYRGDPANLDCLVHFSLGVYNRKIRDQTHLQTFSN